ncbi:MAG TPA: hypothetical protein VGA30_07520 [Actinomycetota bacterium]
MPARVIAAVGAGLAWSAVLVVPPGEAATARPSASPSAGSGLGSTGSGPGFVVLAVVLVAALLFSAWRLRRNR